MIRAHVKPCEITHWSGMPDTLHLPGHKAGKSFRDVSLPQYYRESFFSKDSLFHPELRGGRLGVAGDPVPYTVAGDNFITSLLLLCFVLACIAFSKSKHFVFRQAKAFFRVQREGTTVITETSSEVPVLLCIADLPAGGTRILLLLEGIHQRYVYHRAELGNLYLCRICDELLPDQGFALYHSGSGILR